MGLAVLIGFPPEQEGNQVPRVYVIPARTG
jgi:hypothetical protein